MARTTKLVPPAKSGGVKEDIGTQIRVLTCEFVEFEGECYREEEELVGDGDEEGDSQVVIV